MAARLGHRTRRCSLRLPAVRRSGVASSLPSCVFPAERAYAARVRRHGVQCAGADDLHASLSDFRGLLEQSDCLFICPVGPALELDGQLVARATPEQLPV
jgi:hypothetical protein